MLNNDASRICYRFSLSPFLLFSLSHTITRTIDSFCPFIEDDLINPHSVRRERTFFKCRHLGRQVVDLTSNYEPFCGILNIQTLIPSVFDLEIGLINWNYFREIFFNVLLYSKEFQSLNSYLNFLIIYPMYNINLHVRVCSWLHIYILKVFQ